MADLLPNGVKDLVSTRGSHFKALGIDMEAASQVDLLQGLVKDPLALRRPILWLDDQVVVGYRPGIYRELS